jgi:hypothetical protein
MKPSLIRRLLFYAFAFWPFAAAILFYNVVLFSFGEGNIQKFLSLAFLFGGICIQGLWIHYTSHSGLGDRIHDVLGLTRNPFTGRYGATQREIEEDAERVQGGQRVREPGSNL